VRVERVVNEQYVTDGKVEHLDGHILHFPFAKGVAHWIERHNQYSTMEAAIAWREPRDLAVAELFAKDPTLRRRALKRLGYRLPLRPLLVFAYLYFLRGGFLDGIAGLRFCALRGVYEFFIDLKIREARAS
jgi:hypothetical protein